MMCQYLEKARGVERLCGDNAKDVPGTLLNMSTILSDQDKHSKALACAQEAAELLRRQVEENVNDSSELATNMSLLAVAHHNIGVEQEHCGRLHEALASYSEVRITKDEAMSRVIL